MNDQSISNQDPFVQVFLDVFDRISEALGKNVPPFVEIEKLRSLPSGTLGRSLADCLDKNQLTPFTTGPRRKQLHDSVHVLTGYDTDPVGEAEVQAFLLGAKFHPLQIILGLGTLKLIHRHNTTIPWERLWRAYQRGQNSQFDVDSWQPELYWDWSLNRVQALFHL